MILPAVKFSLEPDEIVGLTISKIDDDGEKIVTQVEVLSPANKPGGSNHLDYLRKRDEVLLSGIKLVEIDYLHERRSIVIDLPDYTKDELGAYPYTISLTQFDTESETGQVNVYAFRVDEPLPIIAIPLENEDTVTLDFDAVYQKTFQRNNRYAGLYVDYEHLPHNFERYGLEDRQRIESLRDRLTQSTQ